MQYQIYAIKWCENYACTNHQYFMTVNAKRVNATNQYAVHDADGFYYGY